MQGRQLQKSASGILAVLRHSLCLHSCWDSVGCAIFQLFHMEHGTGTAQAKVALMVAHMRQDRRPLVLNWAA